MENDIRTTTKILGHRQAATAVKAAHDAAIERIRKAMMPGAKALACVTDQPARDIKVEIESVRLVWSPAVPGGSSYVSCDRVSPEALARVYAYAVDRTAQIIRESEAELAPIAAYDAVGKTEERSLGS